MNSNIDINMLMQIMNGKNPQQLILNYLQKSPLGSTPIGQNLIQLSQKGDYAALEQIARNICQQKGLNFEEQFGNFKQSLGMR